nr:probable serine/threonine-protein kinase ifkB [Oryza sativa Japonica Group]
MAPHLRDLSSLVSSMASGPPRGWLPTLARRAASISRAALNPPVRHVSRFPCGSRNMASGNAVKSEQLGKSDERQLTPSPNDPIHTTNGIINSMDKHFPITRGMDNEENGAATEFIAHYGDGRPANVEENGRKIVNAKYSDEVFCRTTVKVPGVKQDPRGAIKELTDGEEDARNQSASEADDDDDDDDDDDEYEEFNDRVDNYSCYGPVS